MNGDDKGSAVTVGSGVTLNLLYPASKAEGKIFVGGTAATIVSAGGYVQGGGHSTLSPTFGLGSDNVLRMHLSHAHFILSFSLIASQNFRSFWQTEISSL